MMSCLVDRAFACDAQRMNSTTPLGVRCDEEAGLADRFGIALEP